MDITIRMWVIKNNMSYIENGYWNEKKKKLKQKYPAITEKDLFYNQGEEKIMMRILCGKLGKTEQELLYIIVTL